MSTTLSQGDKLAQVSSLMSGSRDVPATVNGESFNNPVSSRAPVTRSEPRAVKPVAPPSHEELAAADMSPLAVSLKEMKLPELTPELFHRGQALEQKITAFWNRAQEFMDAADEARDANTALNLKLDAAAIWGQARGMREQWEQMKQHHDNVVNLRQIVDFQKSLLKTHGWLASSREWSRCLKWTMKEFGCTEQEALWARPEDIVAGLKQYEAHCKATGYKLGLKSADSRVTASTITATAKAEQKKGRLSSDRQRELVSQLLRGGE